MHIAGRILVQRADIHQVYIHMFCTSMTNSSKKKLKLLESSTNGVHFFFIMSSSALFSALAVFLLSFMAYNLNHSNLKILKFFLIVQTATEDEKATFRAQIGLKVPECERRCTSCAHCEAIQVPTNSQIKNSTTTSGIVYNRGDDNSNNKPLSWKCKCGNLIFNP